MDVGASLREKGATPGKGSGKHFLGAPGVLMVYSLICWQSYSDSEVYLITQSLCGQQFLESTETDKDTGTAPNTMICGTVYTKRVRKNNTSKILTSIPLYPCTLINSMLFSNTKEKLSYSCPPQHPPPHDRDTTPRQTMVT